MILTDHIKKQSNNLPASPDTNIGCYMIINKNTLYKKDETYCKKAKKNAIKILTKPKLSGTKLKQKAIQMQEPFNMLNHTETRLLKQMKSIETKGKQ